MKWFLFSLITIFAWGIWGILTKMSSKHYGWQQIYIVAGLVTLLASLLLYTSSILSKGQLNLGSPGFNYALAAGVAGTIALMSFYNAIKYGKVSVVVPFTALYPIITVTFSFIFLGERISIHQGLGIIFALIATILLSTS